MVPIKEAPWRSGAEDNHQTMKKSLESVEKHNIEAQRVEHSQTETSFRPKKDLPDGEKYIEYVPIYCKTEYGVRG